MACSATRRATSGCAERIYEAVLQSAIRNGSRC